MRRIEYKPLSKVVICALVVMLLTGCGGEQAAPLATATTTSPGGAGQPQASLTQTALMPGEPPAAIAATETAMTAAIETEVAFNDQARGTPVAQGGLDLSKVDPCALLTEAEVKAVLGSVKYDPVEESFPNLSSMRRCIYVAQIESSADPLLEVRVGPLGDWEEDKAFLGATGDLVQVTGVGDEAFTVDAITWQRIMVLLRGKAQVEVLVYPPNAEHAKQLALKVIEKLP